mgnify:CR=1 FL=1
MSEETGIAAVPVETLPTEYRQELDIWVETSKRHPRDVEKCLKQMRDLVFMDDETARQCYYVIPPRRKKMPDGTWGLGDPIQGPGIRLAEIVATCWTNLRYGARIIKIDRVNWEVTLQAYCYDGQNNVPFTTEYLQPITIRTPDGIKLACASGSSIAVRNAVFHVVPRAYANRIYKDAMEHVKQADKKEPIEKRRESVVAYFGKLGITAQQICSVCQVATVAELTEEHLLNLRGIATAVRDGEASLKEVFPPQAPEGEPVPAPDLKAEAKKRSAKAAPDERQMLKAEVERLTVGLAGAEFDEISGEVGPENWNIFTEPQLRELVKRLTDYRAAKAEQGVLI